MNKSLMVNGTDFDTMQRMSVALYKSQYFSDAKSEAQAIVKVMAGNELGLPPFASMTGIHIIQGKPALGANVIATLIKNDPRYNYRVLELTDNICKIQFFEDGEPCGVSEFTISDAKKAGTKNLDKFPKNMLFARAISNGAKWFTPGIFGGSSVYTPEELGANVDEDGYIVQEQSTTDNGPKWEDLPSESEKVEAVIEGDFDDDPPNNLADFAKWYAERDPRFENNIQVVTALQNIYDKSIGITFGQRSASEYLDALKNL